MKGLIVKLLLLTFASVGFSQIPFQSVVMDANGIVANDSLRFLVSIVDLNSNPIFQEQHSVSSNEYGLVSFHLSEGVVQSGSWVSIDWGADLMMDVQMSRKTLNDWGPLEFFGSQTFSAVPYAYYATQANEGPQGEVGDQGDQGPIGETGEQGPQGEIGDTGDQGLNGNYIDTVYWNQEELIFAMSDGTTQSIPASGGKGCKQLGACNYSDAAWIEDGSCKWQGDPCNDQEDFTFADVLDSACACHGVDYHLIDTTISIREPAQRSGCNGQTTLLYEGRDYKLVEIDGQCWFAENLDFFNDYISIDSSYSAHPAGWEPFKRICMAPQFKEQNRSRFGLLFDRKSNDSYPEVYLTNLSGLCPSGWHASKASDWSHIELYSGLRLADLFSIDFRGNSADKFGQASNFTNAQINFNDALGFNALPTGYGKYDYDSANYYFGTGAFFHVEPDRSNQLYFPVKTIFKDYAGIRSHFGKDYYSIRCVKD
jgi:uncharacterized protein (TIGR02145 family)